MEVDVDVDALKVWERGTEREREDVGRAGPVTGGVAPGGRAGVRP